MSNEVGVQFKVVDRTNLPADLAYEGKYGPLLGAIAKMTDQEAIHIIPNGGGAPETLRVYAALNYKLRKDERFNNIHLAQRGGQLWIYRKGE